MTGIKVPKEAVIDGVVCCIAKTPSAYAAPSDNTAAYTIDNQTPQENSTKIWKESNSNMIQAK